MILFKIVLFHYLNVLLNINYNVGYLVIMVFMEFTYLNKKIVSEASGIQVSRCILEGHRNVVQLWVSIYPHIHAFLNRYLCLSSIPCGTCIPRGTCIPLLRIRGKGSWDYYRSPDSNQGLRPATEPSSTLFTIEVRARGLPAIVIQNYKIIN